MEAKRSATIPSLPWTWQGGCPQRITGPDATLIAEVYENPDMPAVIAPLICDAVNIYFGVDGSKTYGEAFSWPERVIVDGREVPVVIDLTSDHSGVVEWNSDFTNNPTTPNRIVLRAHEERVLLHEVLHCLLGDNEALVRRATLLYDLGWRPSRV